MVSKITQDQGKSELGFPKLMIHGDIGCVVLFLSRRGPGICVHSGESGINMNDPYGENWQWDDYVDFHGTVELRN